MSSIISWICPCMGCELLILQYLSKAWSLLLLKHSARVLKKRELADDKNIYFPRLEKYVFNFRSFRQKQSRRNETKPCFLFSLRHRYANVSHDAGIPLAKIPLIWITPSKCIIKVMQDTFQTVRLICMPSSTRGSHKYGKKT